MTSRRMLLNAVLVLTLVGAGAEMTEANYGSPRQYYSHWQKHPTHNYHYRNYYYKPRASYSGYKHHYVVYHPSRPKHVYYYNPYKRQYWGRCEIHREGRDEYSLLPEAARKGSLNEIPEAAFPPPAPTPSIPEAEDSTALDLPPDDVPATADLAPAA